MSRVFGAPMTGQLRQGEILRNIWEYRHQLPAVEPTESTEPVVNAIHHPCLVVLTADCDLEQDFKARYPGDFSFRSETEQKKFETNGDLYKVHYVLSCGAYAPNEIHARTNINRRDLDRIEGNRNNRYCHLGSGRVHDSARKLDLIVDFRAVFPLPVESIYEAFRLNRYKRESHVQPLYLQDLIQRFYAFQSRIGLPDR